MIDACRRAGMPFVAEEHGVSRDERQSMPPKNDDLFLPGLDEALSAYLGVAVKRYPNGLTVAAPSPSGFEMTAMVSDAGYALYFDNWVEEFESSEIALQIFTEALKGKARLKVDLLAGRRWRWTLERLNDAGEWFAESTTDHVIWRFWGRQSTIYLRNAFPLRPGSADGGIRRAN